MNVTDDILQELADSITVAEMKMPISVPGAPQAPGVGQLFKEVPAEEEHPGGVSVTPRGANGNKGVKGTRRT